MVLAIRLGGVAADFYFGAAEVDRQTQRGDHLESDDDLSLSSRPAVYSPRNTPA